MGARQEAGAPSPIQRLAGLAAPHKGGYIVSVVLSVLAVACGFLPYAAVSVIATSLLAGVQDWGVYLVWCAITLAGHFAKAVLAGASTLASHKATFAVLTELRLALARKLEQVPLGYVLETPSGTLKNPFVERAEQLEVPLAHALPELTSNLLVPLGIVVVIFVIDWRMGLASLATVPIGIAAYLVGMRDYDEKYGRMIAAKNHMGATIVEYIGGIKVIKAFGQGASSYRKFTEAVKANSDLMLDWMKVMLPSTAVMMNVWPAVFLGVLPLGCLFVADGSLSAPDFITVIALSLGIMGPLFTAVMLTSDISKINTVMDELGQVLDQEEMRRPSAAAGLGGHGLELSGVTFGYGRKQVLKGVDLSIPEGATVALVGPSGSGKSTIAKLIASQWEADGGTVRIGGVDLRDIPLSQAADLISYVAQDNYLFNETVMDNIRMGRAGATDEEVVACAKQSGCHEFICGLEQGYQTVVGGAGGHLSGGERQRVAIARAMMKNAPVVILDEATAYADPENEAIIQDAVARLTRGKTLIVVAHRLSTITDADLIAVVEDGRIAATGTHDELLAQCPLYARMWTAHDSARDAA